MLSRKRNIASQKNSWGVMLSWFSFCQVSRVKQSDSIASVFPQTLLFSLWIIILIKTLTGQELATVTVRYNTKFNKNLYGFLHYHFNVSPPQSSRWRRKNKGKGHFCFSKSPLHENNSHTKTQAQFCKGQRDLFIYFWTPESSSDPTIGTSRLREDPKERLLLSN